MIMKYANSKYYQIKMAIVQDYSHFSVFSLPLDPQFTSCLYDPLYLRQGECLFGLYTYYFPSNIFATADFTALSSATYGSVI